MMNPLKTIGVAAATLGLALLPTVASADGGAVPGFSDDSGDTTVFTTPQAPAVAPEAAYPNYANIIQAINQEDQTVLGAIFQGNWPKPAPVEEIPAN